MATDCSSLPHQDLWLNICQHARFAYLKVTMQSDHNFDRARTEHLWCAKWNLTLSFLFTIRSDRIIKNELWAEQMFTNSIFVTARMALRIHSLCRYHRSAMVPRIPTIRLIFEKLVWQIRTKPSQRGVTGVRRGPISRTAFAGHDVIMCLETFKITSVPTD